MIELLMGSVQNWECDIMGHMNVRHYLARCHTALGALGIELGLEARRLGDVALEQRFVYHAPARLGDIVEIRGGTRAVGHKTSEWCHFLYNAETGEPIASAAVVGIAFDLAKRKAVAFDEATLRSLRAQVVPGLTI
jgi:acyl-CoA thioester hydrolase